MKLLLSLLLSCFFYYGFGQVPEDTEQVLVRVYESGGFYPSEIVIVYGDSQSETVELKGFRKTKNWTENLDKLHLVLKRIKNEGFTITTSNAGAGVEGYFISTYIFTRNDLIETTKE